MAQNPRPRSFQQRLGDMEDALFAKTNLSGLRVGGPALGTLEAAATSGTRDTQDVFAALNASDPTRLRGEQLDRYGQSRGVRRRPALPAKTEVTIGDSSFTRIASSLSPLVSPPIPGQTTIRIQNAALFTSSGSIYVGRGTSSLEGPIPYTSKVDNGSDWTLNLSAAIARRHDGTEEVVLAQGGNRPIPAGTTVRTQQGNALAAATFTVITETSIPDGEVEVAGVEVVCTQRGEVGNVPVGAISSFGSAPFRGATVTNRQRVTTGQKIQPDPEYLAEIAAGEASRSRGTSQALERFALQVTTPDESATCTSASYVDRSDAEPAVLTVDDGTGYQPIENGIGEEQLVGSAVGGEKDFELAGKPIVKARLRTTVAPPWQVLASQALAFEVGGVVTEHSLNPSRYPAGAEPYAVADDCNSDARLNWEAVVVDHGQGLAFRAKTEHQEEIRSVAPPSERANAATVLGIPVQLETTAFLYLNDRLLHRNGRPAAFVSRPFGQWAAVSGPQTVTINVDKTGSATYTIVDSDFVGTGYATVGRNSLSAWATALRRRIPGITPTISKDTLLLVSNLGASSDASVAMDGGSLVSAGFFQLGEATGLNSDFELNRSTAQGQLAVPLAAGDHLALGSDQTRAFLESNIATSVTLAAPATWWIALDSAANPQLLGVSAATSFACLIPAGNQRTWGDRLRLTAATSAFSGLRTGDYVVFWDPSGPTSLYGAWLVASVAEDDSWFELDRRQTTSRREKAASCTLLDGRIFICGGYSLFGELRLRTAEIYDPTTSTWTATGLMTTSRADHWAALLPSGKVLVGGGSSSGAADIPEIWDPATGLFTSTSTTNAPVLALGQRAARLGTVVYVCGGYTLGGYLDDLWSYTEGSDTWAALATMTDPRAWHSFTAFNSLLWAAGGANPTRLSAVEQFDPGAGTWSSGGTLSDARHSHGASVVGTTLVVTGGSSAAPLGAPTRLSSVDILPNTGPPWTAGPAMNTARAYHAQVTLSGGKMLVAGGEAAANPAELYDPGGPSWANTGQPLISPLQAPIGAALSSNSALLAFGALSGDSTSQSEIWTLASGTWAGTDPLSEISFSLSSGGLNFGRAQDRLRRYQIAAAVTQTATALQSSLNTTLDQSGAGSYADRRRTTTLRWRTNTWGDSTEVTGTQSPGDIAIAAADVDAQAVDLPGQELEVGSTGQKAWVLSGNSEVGTPEFTYSMILGSSGLGAPIPSWPDLTLRRSWPWPTGWLRGLGGGGDAYSKPRTGQAAGLVSQFGTRTLVEEAPGALYLSALRNSPEQGWQPADRAAFACPWQLGPNDNLSVAIGTATSRLTYAPLTYRALKPVGATYSQTGAYQDAGLSPIASLGTSFGINYNFVDHAVYMPARVLTHSADASRRILWRWWQHGRGGEYADITYGVPLAPDQSVEVAVDDLSDAKVHVMVRLAGGALKTGAQIRSSTQLGVAVPSVTSGIATVVIASGLSIVSATRTTNVTTLTLTLPAGVMDHGIPNGTVIYVKSTDVNFSSGLKTITGVTSSAVTYAEVAADAGPDPNIGNVSLDIGEARLDTYSPAVVAGDWLNISSRNSTISSDFRVTMRVSATAGQYLTVIHDHFGASPATTLQWGQIQDPAYLSVFANPAQTATTIAAAVHALYLAGTSPVDPTVTGTGSGTISQSSSQEAVARGTAFSLLDGINAISAQVAPGMPASNYSFTLRDPISPSLATNTDWTNEDVRIAPVTAVATARWLMSAATSGFGAAGVAEPASRGHHLQLSASATGSAAAIQVTGGSANAWGTALVGPSEQATNGGLVALIHSAETTGFVSGGWVVAELLEAAERPVFSSSSSLSVLRANGQLSLQNTSPKLWQAPAGVAFYQAGVAVSIEREGRFIRYQDLGVATNLSISSLNEGDWVIISTPASPTVGAPQIAATNCGLHRIVRVSSDGGSGAHCFWVESTTHVPGTICEADFRFFADGSVLPGDTIIFGTDAWGSANQATWTVSSLGDDGGGAYNDEWTVNLDATARSPVLTSGPILLGSDYPLFRALPPTPQRWFKRVVSIYPDPDDASLARVKMTGDSGWEYINAAHGATIVALDKLEFPTSIAQGRDAYRYNVGLVGEVNRVLVGDPANPATYPGVEAARSLVSVDGPRIRRVFFSLQARLRNGYAPNDVITAIQSAVAAAVKARKHGIPIPISDLITQASRVTGVEAIAPISPYNSTEDTIAVSPGERALVLSPSTDVSVSVVGG